MSPDVLNFNVKPLYLAGEAYWPLGVMSFLEDFVCGGKKEAEEPSSLTAGFSTNLSRQLFGIFGEGIAPDMLDDAIDLVLGGHVRAYVEEFIERLRPCESADSTWTHLVHAGFLARAGRPYLERHGLSDDEYGGMVLVVPNESVRRALMGQIERCMTVRFAGADMEPLSRAFSLGDASGFERALHRLLWAENTFRDHEEDYWRCWLWGLFRAMGARIPFPLSDFGRECLLVRVGQGTALVACSEA